MSILSGNKHEDKPTQIKKKIKKEKIIGNDNIKQTKKHNILSGKITNDNIKVEINKKEDKPFEPKTNKENIMGGTNKIVLKKEKKNILPVNIETHPEPNNENEEVIYKESDIFNDYYLDAKDKYDKAVEDHKEVKKYADEGDERAINDLEEIKKEINKHE